jgi:hypothetical protein
MKNNNSVKMWYLLDSTGGFGWRVVNITDLILTTNQNINDEKKYYWPQNKPIYKASN